MRAHLTSEQMAEVLAGRTDRVVAHHLKSCTWCAEEIATLSAMLGEMRSSATEVAARQRSVAILPVRRAVSGLAWAGAVAALLVAGLMPLALHHRGGAPVAPAKAMVEPGAQVSDEALLNSIQNDLSSSVPESMTPLTGKESSRSSTQ